MRMSKTRKKRQSARPRFTLELDERNGKMRIKATFLPDGTPPDYLGNMPHQLGGIVMKFIQDIMENGKAPAIVAPSPKIILPQDS